MGALRSCPAPWTGWTSKNRRHFKSFIFGWEQIDHSPANAFDVQLSARAVKPALWAAWYTHEPSLVQVLEEWSEAWVAVAMETDGGKPRGVFPAGVHFPDNALPKPWHFVPAYKKLAATGNDEVMPPPKSYKPPSRRDQAERSEERGLRGSSANC
jgi:hypothetical protein